MDTKKQILLRRFTQHSEHCYVCKTSGGKSIGMCVIGKAIAIAYGQGGKDIDNPIMNELSKLSWDALAIASLYIDEDPDVSWALCLDVIIEQKVEFIWSASEVWWWDHASNSH